MKKLILILTLLWVGTVHADIIPNDREITWNAGVSGGIPTYTNAQNAVTDHGATGDGISDDTAEIQACINALTANQACLLPAGTYKVTAQLNMTTNNTVLRGVGITTIIKSYGTSGDIIRMGTGSEGSIIAVSSGYTKDSTSLTFASAALISSIATGDYVVVHQTNDTFVDVDGCGYCGLEDDETKAMMQIVPITDKVDNVLTIGRPLYFTFLSGLNPGIKEYGMRHHIGIEDMYIENDSSTLNLLTSNIGITKCAYCWVKTIESYNANRSHLKIAETYGVEVRNSYFHHGHAYTSDHAYAIFLFTGNSDTLIEDNIVYYVRHSIILEGGGSGNVIAYNYTKDPYQDNVTWLSEDINTHGAHPYMNLFEGNIHVNINADYTHGSASHNTFLRNNPTGTRTMSTTSGRRTVDVQKANTSLNFVGNILGASSAAGIYDVCVTGCSSTACNSNPAVIRIGCNAPGSQENPPGDINPEDTILLHGNYDYINDSVIWDGGIADHSIPNSYYYGSKPSWYGSCVWPPIDPTGPTINNIPAKLRYEGYSCPTVGSRKGRYNTRLNGGYQ